MQAIILAAGMGKRLGDLTSDRPKCMVEVNGVTLIERMLRQLDAHRLERIVVVVGYRARQLQEFIATLGIRTPVEYVENSIYDKTNNIYSLALAQDYLVRCDTLLLESDIIFEDAVLGLLLADPRENLALVDKYASWMDGTCLVLHGDDTIERFVPGDQFNFADIGQYYKTVNIYKFSRQFSEQFYVPFLQAYPVAFGNNQYYEQVLRTIAILDQSALRAKRLTGQHWYEIDDIADLDIARSIFSSSAAQRVDDTTRRFGGYWRYPDLLDYCLLVNPYFPPAKLLDELRASLDTLVMSYPSGMGVNAMLAAKSFGLTPEHVVVGNGASELIKALPTLAGGITIGLIAPSFEEYAQRAPGDAVVYVPDSEGFAYTADDLIAYFGQHPVGLLVLVNPDNPSGNYIRRDDIDRLLKWAASRGMRVLLDESFVDFADEPNASLLQRQILDDNPHLIVVKSISKSYGVPGLRLGVLASGDTELISAVRRDVAIWNINSLAEFYMQVADKYRGDYEHGLARLRDERHSLAVALDGLAGITVYPSQANYLMCRLGTITARDLAARLLQDYDILVKDLTAKTRRYRPGEYIRLAVRSAADNQQLLDALREILGAAE